MMHQCSSSEISKLETLLNFQSHGSMMVECLILEAFKQELSSYQDKGTGVDYES